MQWTSQRTLALNTVNVSDKTKVWWTDPNIQDLIWIIYMHEEPKQATPCMQMYFFYLLSGL